MDKEKLAKALFQFFQTEDSETLNRRFSIWCSGDQDDDGPITEQELQYECNWLAQNLIKECSK